MLLMVLLLPLTFTNLFPLQCGNGIPKAVKAVFDVVPTFALQRIVMCPFVCITIDLDIIVVAHSSAKIDEFTRNVVFKTT